jgi:hypothetical protein
MDLNEFEMTDADFNELANRAFSIMIIHLKARYREDDRWNSHSPLDYHLHIIFTKNESSIFAINLDTSDTVFSDPQYSDIRELTRDMGRRLAETFVDRAESLIKARKYKRELLFIKANPVLWEKFNTIKEITYLDSLHRFSEYLNTSKISLDNKYEDVNESSKTISDTYNWANIIYSEERTLEPA